MADVTETRKAKDRSPVFPFISLEAALGRARQFYEEEKRGVAPFVRAALHWNYSASSSGALQTIAALKNYGLMSESGGTGPSRQLRLTDLALRILLDQRPESEERKEFLRLAAMSPAVSAEIYSKWPEGLPSDSTINHFLVLDKKFNESTALKVVKIVKENHAFASIQLSSNQSVNGMINGDPDFELEGSMIAVEEDKKGVGNRRQVDQEPAKIMASGQQVGASIPVTSSCSMSIVAEGDVTQDGIDRLIQYLQLIKGSFPKSLTEVSDGSMH